jgi:hypothetical protein
MFKKRLWLMLLAISVSLAVVTSNGFAHLQRSSAQPAGDPTCASASPCIEYRNTSFGPGIEGVSNSGNGVAGTSTTGVGVNATSTSGIGVNAVSTTNSGVYGLTSNPSKTYKDSKAGVQGVDYSVDGGTLDYGVLGTSFSGRGVQGVSGSGNGVTGTTSSTTGGSGVAGIAGGPGDGVYGKSTSGRGVDGVSTSGNGVTGTTGSTSGNSGVAGISTGTGHGVYGSSAKGIGIYATAINNVGLNVVGGFYPGSGFTEFPALSIVGDSTGASGSTNDLIDACPSNTINPCTSVSKAGSPFPKYSVFQVNGEGALYAYAGLTTRGMIETYSGVNIGGSGEYTKDGTCVAGCSSSATSTWRVRTYSAQSSQPAVEDYGEAQLVLGHAYVQLDKAFANVIDQRATYLVTITPEGDSNGLYVTDKTAMGFMVRENRGGRSSLQFSYRIVAKPYGANQPRLPMVDEPEVRSVTSG